MGTRSLTRVFDENNREIICLYRQYDGGPNFHGKELRKFAKKGKLVNGFGSSNQPDFNGMGCFAAQLVAHFKTGIGSFYLYPPGTEDAGQEYEYHCRPKGDTIEIECLEV